MFSLDNIHSLTEFRRNAGSYADQIRKGKTPLVLTVNGEAALVVHDAKAFQEIVNRLESLQEEVKHFKLEKLRAELQRGEESGAPVPYDLDAIDEEVLAELE